VTGLDASGIKSGIALKSSSKTLSALLLSGSALAQCQNTGNFTLTHWMNSFKQQAAASGIPANLVNNALNNVRFDPRD